MLVYLGGPIDLVSDTEAKNWRSKFAQDLAAREISSFNPATAFRYCGGSGDSRAAKKLIKINREALLASDFAVFVMDKNTPSIGTPMELLMAEENGIPHVVIWRSGGQLPAYVAGMADKVVSMFDHALSHIVQYADKHKLRPMMATLKDAEERLGTNIDIKA